jgi:lipopolysaccharide heptosyltransferase I
VNVLIVRLSAMGDILHALPLAANAARAGHRVGWVVERPFASLLRGNKHIYELIVTDTKRIRRRLLSTNGIGELRSLRAALKGFAPDVVLDPQGNEKSFWVSQLAGAPRVVLDDARFRRNWTRRFSALRVEPPTTTRHVSEKIVALLGAIRIPVVETAPDARYLLRSRDDVAEAFLPTVPRPFALYHPGAGWANKSWGEERFAELARGVREQLGIHPIVSWGPGDEMRAENLARRTGAVRIPAVGFPGLARIVSQAAFFAGGDTGPLHLADALGVMTVGLFGPTDPARTGPFRRNGPVFFARLSCSPCNSRYSETKKCLREILPAAVLSALDRRELPT